MLAPCDDLAVKTDDTIAKLLARIAGFDIYSTKNEEKMCGISVAQAKIILGSILEIRGKKGKILPLAESMKEQ